MTDSVRQTLTALLKQHGFQTGQGDGCLEVLKTSAIAHPSVVGKLRVVVEDTVEMLEMVRDGKREVIPLCSPFLPQRIDKVFGRPPPKWDPNR